MRIGIVGAGFMGSTHAAAWAEIGVGPAGFVSESGAVRLAEQYNAIAYPTMEAMLADVDVVDVCAPTHHHYEIVLAAAAAGKDVICEKPLARTVEQGQAMIAECRRAGVELLVAHVVRFFPEYALAKSLVEGGKVGRPGVLRLLRGSFRPKKPAGNWFLDVEKSGGLLLDMMIHDFDYARWVAGEVESVFARSVGTSVPGAPLDYGMAILTHREGALSHVTGAWAYPPPTFRTHLEIAGDRGLIQFDSADTASVEMRLQKSSDDSSPDVGLPTSPLRESPFATQLREFYEHLAHGRPVRVTAKDGLAALQIALAAVESAATGRPVHLTPLRELQP